MCSRSAAVGVGLELENNTPRASQRSATGGFSDFACVGAATRGIVELIVQPAQSSGVGWISFICATLDSTVQPAQLSGVGWMFFWGR